jgi:hypothetical protein
MTPEEAFRAIDALLLNGYLHEQCACGCDKEHHRGGGGQLPGFCHVCWSDNCNSYRPVFVRTAKLPKGKVPLFSFMQDELLRRQGRGGIGGN